MTLEEAFELANKVHELADISLKFTYLTLVCTGLYDEERWAATFDFVDDDPDWYEGVEGYKFSARADTPQEAIEKACRKVLQEEEQR